MLQYYLSLFVFKYARNSPSLANSITIQMGITLQMPIKRIIWG